ncbi:MAG: lactate utilization protein [Candidatus Adiutrix sp.]|jgi:hypothetical protein|nr:lactate utilization protein [Candidatus Adiutrix sp.]
MNDMEIKAWHLQCKAGRLMKKMEKRGFQVAYAPTAEEAKKAILEQVPATGAIGLLGSQTMNQIGVFAHLRASGRELVDHAGQKGVLGPDDFWNYMARVFTAEAMLASANAVDSEGRLYNIDGTGNRVASMIFGPKKVILGISLNKVADSPEEAWKRARQTASPMNSQRLSLPTPCVKSGHCHDCQLEASICNYFTVIDRSRPVGRISVVLIGEDCGY